MTHLLTHAFLSYSHSNAPFVYRLAADIEKQGLSVWFDRYLEAGNASKQIDRAIDSAYALVTVQSAAALKSEYVRGEWSRAIHQKKIVIPLLLEKITLPAGISDFEMVNFAEADYHVARSRLIELLEQAAQDPVHLNNRLPLQPITLELPEDTSMRFVPVPAGSFLAGEHRTSVPTSAYYIGETPVTVKQFHLFEQSNEYDNKNYWPKRGWGQRVSGPTLSILSQEFRNDNNPQVMVSWYDAVAYAKWLSQVTGYYIRLPNELEWEKAARGTDGRPYPWGLEPPTPLFCNINEYIGHTSPVTAHPAGKSPYGVLDLIGNVQEWCRNRADQDPYQPSDPQKEIENGSIRSLRSCSWLAAPEEAECFHRQMAFPSIKNNLIGFRVAIAT